MQEGVEARSGGRRIASVCDVNVAYQFNRRSRVPRGSGFREAALAAQALGLDADVGIDWIKSKTLRKQSLCDEGYRGHILPFDKGPRVSCTGAGTGRERSTSRTECVKGR